MNTILVSYEIATRGKKAKSLFLTSLLQTIGSDTYSEHFSLDSPLFIIRTDKTAQDFTDRLEPYLRKEDFCIIINIGDTPFNSQDGINTHYFNM
jgi:hypothetical protein